MGVIVVDIGSGTTGVAVYNEGTVWHTACIPVAGTHFTNDVAIGLRINTSAAEEMKVRYGRADASAVDSQEQIDVYENGATRRSVSRKELCEILKERAVEVFRMVDMNVRKACPNFNPGAGMVLTGGTATMPGLDLIAREALRMPVRVGKPVGVAGLAETIDSPAYSASLGLLLWGINQNEADFRPTRGIQIPSELPKKVSSAVKNLFAW
ncbi:MAG: cell division FtsA domain-containing protein [Chloroflexota bacterium]